MLRSAKFAASSALLGTGMGGGGSGSNSNNTNGGSGVGSTSGEPLYPNLGMHAGAASGNVGMVKYALDHGQPHTSILNGLLPLHAACSGGSEPVCRLLIAYGADVNAPRLKTKPNVATLGSEGSTPLHFAAANGHTSIARLLLEHGARPSAQDKEGLTAEFLATGNGHTSCVSLIRSWMAHYGPNGLAGLGPGASSVHAMAAEPGSHHHRQRPSPASSQVGSPRSTRKDGAQLRAQRSLEQLASANGVAATKVTPSRLLAESVLGKTSSNPNLKGSSTSAAGIAARKGSWGTASDAGRDASSESTHSQPTGTAGVRSPSPLTEDDVREMGFSSSMTPPAPPPSLSPLPTHFFSSKESKRRPSLPFLFERAANSTSSTLRAALHPSPNVPASIASADDRVEILAWDGRGSAPYGTMPPSPSRANQRVGAGKRSFSNLLRKATGGGGSSLAASSTSDASGPAGLSHSSSSGGPLTSPTRLMSGSDSEPPSSGLHNSFSADSLTRITSRASSSNNSKASLDLDRAKPVASAPATQATFRTTSSGPAVPAGSSQSHKQMRRSPSASPGPTTPQVDSSPRASSQYGDGPSGSVGSVGRKKSSSFSRLVVHMPSTLVASERSRATADLPGTGMTSSGSASTSGGGGAAFMGTAGSVSGGIMADEGTSKRAGSIGHSYRPRKSSNLSSAPPVVKAPSPDGGQGRDGDSSSGVVTPQRSAAAKKAKRASLSASSDGRMESTPQGNKSSSRTSPKVEKTAGKGLDGEVEEEEEEETEDMDAPFEDAKEFIDSNSRPQSSADDGDSHRLPPALRVAPSSHQSATRQRSPSPSARRLLLPTTPRSDVDSNLAAVLGHGHGMDPSSPLQGSDPQQLMHRASSGSLSGTSSASMPSGVPSLTQYEGPGSVRASPRRMFEEMAHQQQQQQPHPPLTARSSAPGSAPTSAVQTPATPSGVVLTRPSRSGSNAGSMASKASTSSLRSAAGIPPNVSAAEQAQAILRQAEQFSADGKVGGGEDGTQVSLAQMLAAYGEALAAERKTTTSSASSSTAGSLPASAFGQVRRQTSLASLSGRQLPSVHEDPRHHPQRQHPRDQGPLTMPNSAGPTFRGTFTGHSSTPPPNSPHSRPQDVGRFLSSSGASANSAAAAAAALGMRNRAKSNDEARRAAVLNEANKTRTFATAGSGGGGSVSAGGSNSAGPSVTTSPRATFQRRNEQLPPTPTSTDAPSSLSTLPKSATADAALDWTVSNNGGEPMPHSPLRSRAATDALPRGQVPILGRAPQASSQAARPVAQGRASEDWLRTKRHAHQNGVSNTVMASGMASDPAGPHSRTGIPSLGPIGVDGTGSLMGDALGGEGGVGQSVHRHSPSLPSELMGYPEQSRGVDASGLRPMHLLGGSPSSKPVSVRGTRGVVSGAYAGAAQDGANGGGLVGLGFGSGSGSASEYDGDRNSASLGLPRQGSRPQLRSTMPSPGAGERERGGTVSSATSSDAALPITPQRGPSRSGSEHSASATAPPSRDGHPVNINVTPSYYLGSAGGGGGGGGGVGGNGGFAGSAYRSHLADTDSLHAKLHRLTPSVSSTSSSGAASRDPRPSHDGGVGEVAARRRPSAGDPASNFNAAAANAVHGGGGGGGTPSKKKTFKGLLGMRKREA